jgi:hypothetical protein
MTTLKPMSLIGSAAAIAMAVSAASAVALESLGPNEIPTAVSWSTTGGYNFQDLNGGPNLETLVFHPVADPTLPHSILPGTATISVLDVVTSATRSINVDAADPFFARQFNFENLELNPADIPPVGTNTGNVGYITNYGPGSAFATQVNNSNGFLTADAYRGTAPRPYMQANAASAVFDCCDLADMDNIVYGTPSTGDLWLDTDGDGVADHNVETLLASTGEDNGLLNSTLQVADVACPNVLQETRGQCVPATKSMSSSFQIPLQIPTPDLVCTGQSFGANADTAAEGEDIIKTFTIEGIDLATQTCSNVLVTEEITCAGGDLDLSATGWNLPAGCTIVENPADSGTYEISCGGVVNLTSVNPTANLSFITSFIGTEGNCTARMTSLTCDATNSGTLVGSVAGCQDTIARSTPPQIIPAISPLGLGALLLGLPLVGGVVARRRARKG